MEYRVEGMFPCPLYITHRNSDLDVFELGDIESIIEGGMNKNMYNSNSVDTYIFETKLNKIKKFCEEHINIYVEKVISPKENLEFYITQSWLNLTKQGESHQKHWHPNSILSGVFYISTAMNDGIKFHDPHSKVRERFNILTARNHVFNAGERTQPVKPLDLILFPSWIEHHVELNNSKEDRVSLSFNVFARGVLGDKNKLTELTI